MLKKFVDEYGDYIYLIFRVLVGYMFFLHGGQKLFGWFGGLGGQSAQIFSLMGLAGIIETFGGIAVMLGIFTRFAALWNALLMTSAYITVHTKPSIFFPITNGGDTALLFLVSFLIVIMNGARKFSLEKAIFKKELF